MLALANRWFERTTMGSGLTLLWEPHVHPFLRCNIWHLRGRDRDLLIDTGLGIASLRQEIADLADKPLLAVATHIHYDHVGSLHEFDERLMHVAEAPRMERYDEFAALRSSAFPSDYRHLMAHEAFGDSLINAAPEDFDIDAFRIRPASVTRTVAEGDVLDLGDRHFEVLHLPGHSPGSIGLWEPASGILFSGDAVYDGTLLDDLPDSNVDDYVATMRRLRELPVTIVHGGHEPSFGRARLVELVDAYLADKT